MDRTSRLRRLAQALGKQGMVFAKVGAHNQYTLHRGQASDRGSQSTHPFVGREICIA